MPTQPKYQVFPSTDLISCATGRGVYLVKNLATKQFSLAVYEPTGFRLMLLTRPLSNKLPCSHIKIQFKNKEPKTEFYAEFDNDMALINYITEDMYKEMEPAIQIDEQLVQVLGYTLIESKAEEEQEEKKAEEKPKKYDLFRINNRVQSTNKLVHPLCLIKEKSENGMSSLGILFRMFGQITLLRPSSMDQQATKMQIRIREGMNIVLTFTAEYDTNEPATISLDECEEHDETKAIYSPDVRPLGYADARKIKFTEEEEKKQDEQAEVAPAPVPAPAPNGAIVHARVQSSTRVWANEDVYAMKAAYRCTTTNRLAHLKVYGRAVMKPNIRQANELASWQHLPSLKLYIPGDGSAPELLTKLFDMISYNLYLTLDGFDALEPLVKTNSNVEAAANSDIRFVEEVVMNDDNLTFTMRVSDYNAGYPATLYGRRAVLLREEKDSKISFMNSLTIYSINMSRFVDGRSKRGSDTNMYTLYDSKEAWEADA